MKLNKFAYLYSKPLGNHTLKIMKKIPGNLLKKTWKNHGNIMEFCQSEKVGTLSVYPNTILNTVQTDGWNKHCTAHSEKTQHSQTAQLYQVRNMAAVYAKGNTDCTKSRKYIQRTYWTFSFRVVLVEKFLSE